MIADHRQGSYNRSMAIWLLHHPSGSKVAEKMECHRHHLTWMDTKRSVPSATDWMTFHCCCSSLDDAATTNAMNSNDDGDHLANEICRRPNRCRSMPAMWTYDHWATVANDGAADDGGGDAALSQKIVDWIAVDVALFVRLSCEEHDLLKTPV